MSHPGKMVNLYVNFAQLLPEDRRFWCQYQLKKLRLRVSYPR